MTTAHNGWQQEIMQYKQGQIIILFVGFQVLGDTNWPDTNWPTQPGSLEGRRENLGTRLACIQMPVKKIGREIMRGVRGWLCIA